MTLRRSLGRSLACGMVLVASLLPIGAFAFGHAAIEDPPAADPNDPNAADREQLRELKRLYEAAASEGKPELLQEYLAPGFTAVMVTGDELTTYDELTAFWQRIRSLLGEGGRYSVEVLIDRPASFDGNLAIATGRTKDHVQPGNGTTYDFEGRFTAVFVRARDRWNVLRIHGSMDPITNPFVIAAMKPVMWTGVVAGGVGGLAVGGVLGLLVGTRRGRRLANR